MRSLALFLTLLTSAPAHCAAPDLEGTVVALSRRHDSLSVSLSWPHEVADAVLDIEAASIGHGTREGQIRVAAAEELRRGVRVLVWLDGPLAESSPPQGKARAVRIVVPADKPATLQEALEQALAEEVSPRPEGLEAVLADALERRWITPEEDLELRSARGLYEVLAKAGVEDAARASEEVSWVAVPGQHPASIPSAETLGEALDLAQRTLKSGKLFLKNLGQGKEPMLYYPPRRGDPRRETAGVPVMLMDQEGEDREERAVDTRAILSTAAPISILRYRDLEGLAPEIVGLLEASFLGQVTVFLIARRVELTVFAERPGLEGQHPVSAEALFLIADCSMIGVTHLEELGLMIQGAGSEMRIFKR